MVVCLKYVCNVHFLLIWWLLRKDYTANNLIKVWHWNDQIIFVYSLSKSLPRYVGQVSTYKYDITTDIVLRGCATAMALPIFRAPIAI